MSPNQPSVIDIVLMHAFDKAPRCFVIAANGLPTRQTMVHWATRDGAEPLIVSPPTMMRFYQQLLEPYNHRGMVTSSRIFATRRPFVRSRNLFELSNFNPSVEGLMRDCVQRDLRFVYRIVDPRNQNLIQIARELRLPMVAYTLKAARDGRGLATDVNFVEDPWQHDGE